MKNIALLIIFIAVFTQKGFTQKFADKKFYVVDSLDLSIIKESDKLILDSCLTKFHNSKNDSLKVNLIGNFIELCDDNRIWTKYNRWIYQFSKSQLQKRQPKIMELFYREKLIAALSNICYYYDEVGEINLALKYNLEILAMQEELLKEKVSNENLEALATIKGNIGSIYLKQGLTALALKYNYESLSIEEKIGNQKGIAISLATIAHIHNFQGQYDDALELFFKSLIIRKKIGDKRGESNVLNNIGLIYDNKKMLDTALVYYLKSLAIREELQEESGIAVCLNNIGFMYYQKNELNKAYDFCNRSLILREKLGEKEHISSTLNNLGQIELKMGKLKEAKESGLKALVIAKELGIVELIQVNAQLLSEVAFMKGDFKQAFEMRNLEILMKDSVLNETNKNATLKQNAKYEYDKKEVLIKAEHEKKLAIEKEAKAKQTIISYAIAGGLGLVAVFLVFVYNRLQVTKKQKNTIETQKIIVEKAHHDLEEKNKEIMDSINYARRIQAAILPPQKLVKKYLPQSFVLYKPKDVVAGDFYWMEHQHTKVIFAVADCTGHGVPGAMVSVVCNNGLNRSVREYGLSVPGKILDKTREIVIQEFEKSDEEVKDGMDISLCELDTKSNRLKWSGANNPLWIIRKDTNEVVEIKADKQPIGKYAEPKPFTTHEIDLHLGDSIYIFTDGYQDQFGGEKGKKFKASKLREILLSVQHEVMEKQCEILNQAFEKWKGNLEQVDDVCVIGVRI